MDRSNPLVIKSCDGSLVIPGGAEMDEDEVLFAVASYYHGEAVAWEIMMQDESEDGVMMSRVVEV